MLLSPYVTIDLTLWEMRQIYAMQHFIKIYLFSFVELENREKEDVQPVHVINIDIQDNHEEATIGAFMICDLCIVVSTITITGAL